MFVRLGVERLADYQDIAYARDYLDRLKPIAEIDKKHGGGQLLAETARELALGMAYEDTVRVAELKIRPSRFERVRAEASERERACHLRERGAEICCVAVQRDCRSHFRGHHQRSEPARKGREPRRVRISKRTMGRGWG